MSVDLVKWTERGEMIDGHPTVLITGERGGYKVHARYNPKASQVLRTVELIRGRIEQILSPNATKRFFWNDRDDQIFLLAVYENSTNCVYWHDVKSQFIPCNSSAIEDINQYVTLVQYTLNKALHE